MFGLIRRIKLVYELYNFFNPKSLSHNLRVYKKLGIKKRYFSSVSSKDFIHLNQHLISLKTDFSSLEETNLYGKFSEQNKKSLDEFNETGYAIIKNYLSEDEVDRINNEIDLLLTKKKIKIGHRGKIMFAIHASPLLKNIGSDKYLIELLSALTKKEMTLFQSINFLYGSEQNTHSDSIHMTTFPLGGLLGVWIALEDIIETNGPLHYYPGSHKLPYYLNADYDNEGNRYFLGKKDYTEYEEMIARKLIENKTEKKIFKANKGDLLIWHANLMHGGEPHTDKTRTRKSMVFHYFDINSVCYHEITQRPALMKE
jgi:phytanoyl-CoA hydroxylase